LLRQTRLILIKIFKSLFIRLFLPTVLSIAKKTFILGNKYSAAEKDHSPRITTPYTPDLQKNSKLVEKLLEKM